MKGKRVLKKQSNKNGLLSTYFASLFSVLLCFVMLLGTTFAWFTDNVTSANNIIKSGTLAVEMYYGDSKDTATQIIDDKTPPIFNYSLWEPGYTQVKYVKIVNAGDLAFQYKLNIVPAKKPAAGEPNLADVIDVYMVAADQAPEERVDVDSIIASGKGTTLSELMADPDGAAYGAMLPENSALSVSPAEEMKVEPVVGAATYCIILHMQETAGNEYQNLTVGDGFAVQLLATQLGAEIDSFDNQYDVNAEYPKMTDEWDGTVDISWYNDTDTEFTLTTAEALAGLAVLVDKGTTFEGKTIKLDVDMDLYCEDESGEPLSFDPIGSYRNEQAFKGTFDGQGHTISNMSQNTWALNNGYYYGDLGLGLFGLVEDATVKELVMDGASISGESAIVGIVAATAYGDCTFENIKVTNSQGADYQYYAGGVVGWASGEHQYINCDVDATTTIAGQWGDFDNSNGGVIGGAGGNAKIVMKDCDVACRIDAYNDVTSSYQWYAYRRSGMLIGNTGKTEVVDGTTYAAAPQLTCENVTVTYGDWANYTYCEFAGTSWPYVRVQAGVSNSAYSNPRYGHPTDANGNEVVDDNHVHNEGEDHFILCAFDQLYGGGQGVYGTASHDGVTVIYNNK